MCVSIMFGVLHSTTTCTYVHTLHIEQPRSVVKNEKVQRIESTIYNVMIIKYQRNNIVLASIHVQLLQSHNYNTSSTSGRETKASVYM